MSDAGDENATIEAELKFRLEDPEEFRRAIAGLGAVREGVAHQRDVYFAHPLRDFAETDEALRIRITDDSGRMTYKGPRFDAETKSRHETEIAFTGGPADAERFGRVLETLDFTAVREVSKVRELWSLSTPSGMVEIAIDMVEGLGTFVELERTVPARDYEQAKMAIQSLASQLGLTTPEHRSYLGLLLTRDREVG